VISAIGPTLQGVSTAAPISELKISPDCKKLASTTNSNSIPSSLGLGEVHLFDFDASSGIVSSSLTLLTDIGAYGVEFSPDGSKLYGVITPNCKKGGLPPFFLN
jgi:hypothetical protein